MARVKRFKVWHKIVIKAHIVPEAPDGVFRRFSGKDLRTGVGAAGATPEAARRQIMAYLRAFPEKLRGETITEPGN